MKINNNENLNQEFLAFKQGVENWANDPQASQDERRREAADKIIDCKFRDLKKLSLSYFQLKTLPKEIWRERPQLRVKSLF